MISITIPTLKDNSDQLEELRPYLTSVHGPVELVVVTKQQSAAKNRNLCLDRASYDLIVMMDDDVYGFHEGWLDELVRPIIESPNTYSIISARFRNPLTGVYQGTLGDCGKRKPFGDLQIAIQSRATRLQLVCSACIAFRKSAGIRFDEEYDGAVYEDTDFCMQMRVKYPQRNIAFNNQCVLEHRCEQKRRWDANGTVASNRAYFARKWRVPESLI